MTEQDSWPIGDMEASMTGVCIYSLLSLILVKIHIFTMHTVYMLIEDSWKLHKSMLFGCNSITLTFRWPYVHKVVFVKDLLIQLHDKFIGCGAAGLHCIMLTDVPIILFTTVVYASFLSSTFFIFQHIQIVYSNTCSIFLCRGLDGGQSVDFRDCKCDDRGDSWQKANRKNKWKMFSLDVFLMTCWEVFCYRVQAC